MDRLWPRGLSKEDAKVDLWLKEIAPSDELRKWFAHDPQKWPEFKRRYFEGLENCPEAVAQIKQHANAGQVTHVYAAKDEAHNNAVALNEYLNKRAR